MNVTSALRRINAALLSQFLFWPLVALAIVAVVLEFGVWEQKETRSGPFARDPFVSADAAGHALGISTRIDRWFGCCIEVRSDSNDRPTQSDVRLWINDFEMGPPHSTSYDLIRGGKSTAFRHWLGYLFFALPPGVENTSAARATIRYSLRPVRGLSWGLALASLLLGAFAYRGQLRHAAGKLAHAITNPQERRLFKERMRRVGQILFWPLVVLAIVATILEFGVWEQEETRTGPFARDPFVSADAAGHALGISTRIDRWFGCCIEVRSDSNDRPTQSDVRLWINDFEMGPPHSTSYDLIRGGKSTAFRHWLGYLFFALPPGVENTSAARATIRYSLRPLRGLTWGLALASLLLGAFAYEAALARFARRWAGLIVACRDRFGPFSISRFADLTLRREGIPFILLFFLAFTIFSLPDAIGRSTGGPSDWLKIATIGVLVVLDHRLGNTQPRVYMTIVRPLGIVLTIFFLLRGFPLEVLPPITNPVEIHHLYWAPKLAIVAAVIGWWRPAAFLYPAVAERWHRETIERHTSVVLGHNEELTLQEMAIFLIVGALAARIVVRVARSSDTGGAQGKLVIESLVLFACACHMANYFCSFLAKTTLTSDPSEWLRRNETFNLMVSGDLFGMLVFGQYDQLKDLILISWQRMNVFVNVITLAIQFLSLPALVSISAIRAMLLIFDIWHASVALLSGIAFYMWMALNIIFTLALGLVRRPMTWSFRLFLVFGMLVASFGFKIFWAGWFDTRGVNLVTLTAEYRDGSEARVPPTIYDFYSYRFYSDAMLDHSWWSKYALPVSFFGSSKIADVRHKMEECTQPPANPGRENSIVFNPAMLRLIRSFHPVVIERSGHSGGRLIYAHHFLQDPAVFSAFRSRNPRDIVSYRVSVDLVCQRVTAAGIEKTVLYSAQTRVRVDGRPAASASP